MKFSWRKRNSMNACAIRAFAYITCRQMDFQKAVQDALQTKDSFEDFLYCKHPELISTEQMDELVNRVKDKLTRSERFNERIRRNGMIPAG